MKRMRTLLVPWAFLVTGMVPGTTLAEPSAPDGVAGVQESIEHLRNAAGEYDFLIEFDVDTMNRQIAGIRSSRGLVFNDASLRAERAAGLETFRRGLFASVPFDSASFRRDYIHLPLSHIKTQSVALVRALQQHPSVKAVFENTAFHAHLADSRPLIQQDKALTLGAKGQGVAVAVIDTGVDYTRSAFGACTAPSVPAACRVVYAREVAPDDGELDANGHGTNVAGIVAGTATGSAIVAFDVFDGASAYTADITRAIDDTIGLKDSYNIVAINLSLGGGLYTAPCSGPPAFLNPFQSSIDTARANGILTVASSGNDGQSDAIGMPACTPGVVSVGAVYDTDVGGRTWSLPAGGTCSDNSTAADQVACFSNSAGILTLLAPGALISAAGSTLAGTSQAAPHVSAAVAVLRSAYPDDSLEQTVARLTDSGVALTDSRNGITKPRLNLLGAVGALNDRIADAVALDGQSGQVFADTGQAGLETGEGPKAGNPGGRSVWWTWQAPESGLVSLDTGGSDFDTLLAVYTGGSIPQLVSIVENDNGSGGVTSKVTFAVVAGGYYTIAVDGKNAASGVAVLNWAYVENDVDTDIPLLPGWGVVTLGLLLMNAARYRKATPERS